MGPRFLVPLAPFTTEARELDDKDVSRLSVPDAAQSLPKGAFVATYPFSVDGSYYIQAKLSGLERGTRLTLYRLDGTWREHARIDVERGVPYFKIIPCKQGRYFGISSKTSDRYKSSPFFSLSGSDAGILSLGSGQEFGFKGSAAAGFFERPYASREVWTPDFLVLLDFDTGLYWSISLEHASVKHAGRLLPGVTDGAILQGRVTKAILQAHPAKNGTVLIMARPESTVMAEGTPSAEAETQKLLKANPGMNPEHAVAYFQSRRQAEREQTPFVDWYSLDPETGAITHLVPPPAGAREVLRAGEGSSWRPLSDGSVRMGPIAPKAPPEAPAPNQPTSPR